MNTSLSIFARALASENISFSFDSKADTASFDIKGRHLTMPVWKVSETVQTMLVAHEISHALWTPYEQANTLFDQAEADGYKIPLLQRICNVIEDVRIEKLMKDKFPGTRRDFFLGYKELYEADLFRLKSVDWTGQNIVSRINAHFKWGQPGFITVPFDADEAGLLDEVDACASYEDVFNLAKRLYDLPMMKDVVKKAEEAEADGLKPERGDTQNPCNDLMDTDIPGAGKKSGNKCHSPTVVIPVVDGLQDAILSTTDILESFELQGKNYPSVNMDDYRQFVRESDSFVRQLVAQFERRKAADAIRKERPKQTGQLNLDRLHQYRTHDDIFLSKIVKQDGKNHGIVFLIDFSGSMGMTIGNCYLQVLQLVWFCEKAKIPFEVFGFTDVNMASLSKYEQQYEAWRKKNPNAYYSDFMKQFNIKIVGPDMNALDHGHARLISLASSRDDADKREKLLAHMYEATVLQKRPLPFAMNGTPTVECVAYASQFIKEWITANNIQIPTLMIVTDGSPNGVSRRETPILTNRKKDENDREEQNIYFIGEDGTLTVVDNITETTTRMHRKDMTGCVGNEVVGMMLNAMRTKFNARLVGMFVGGNTLAEGTFAHFCMSEDERRKSHRTAIADSPRFKAAKECYKDGCIVLHPDAFHGYDAYFLVKTPKIVSDEEAIADAGATFTKVKNQFVKTMGQRSGSRVFLTRYVDIVAGQPLRKGADALYANPVL